MSESNQIPCFRLSKEALAQDEEYKTLCHKMREACETYGCFVVEYDDESTKKLEEDMFVAMKNLFDRPEEIKKRHTSPLPYRGYYGRSPILPLIESFGLDEAHQQHVVQAFTHVIWPEGNMTFRETVKSMSSKMREMNFTILRMLCESLGMGKQYKPPVEDSYFRLMKYNTSSPNKESEIGLVAHTDKNFLTLLCQNEVQGLEVFSKEGHWIQLRVPKNSFIVIVGDSLKVLSNGKLRAAYHRVVIHGHRDRYSCGLFLIPKLEATMEAAKELINKENPPRYRPFKFQDYESYKASSFDAVEKFAGI